MKAMAYKQTSFSRLSTEILCNERKLQRGSSPTEVSSNKYSILSDGSNN
jgi:hypothetical protein